MTMDKVIAVLWIIGARTWAQTPDMDPTVKPSCYQGWTGPNSGGSCSFTTGNFCDWRLVKGDKLKWKLTDDNEAILSPVWHTGPQNGRLRSPPMCEEKGRKICLEVKFKFSSGDGSRLNAEVCGHEATCTRLFRYAYTGNTDWLVATENFVTPGSFEIFIVGEKYENTLLGESDIFIDYIKYNSPSCGEEGMGLVSPVTTMASSTWADESSTEPTISDVTGMSSSIFTSTSLLTSSSLTSASLSTDPWIQEGTGTGTAAGASTVAGGAAESGDEPSEVNGMKENRIDMKSDADDKEEENNPTVIIIAVSAVSLLSLVVIIFVAVFIIRRRRSAAPPKTTDTQPRTGRNESIVTFTNELYTSVEQARALRTEEDTSEEQANQSRARPVTSAERTSQSSDVYYSSVTRPFSSPPHEVNAKKQTSRGINSTDQNNIASGKNEEDVYDNADITDADDKEIYENADKSAAAQDEIYENTAPRDSEPAATAGKADGTYEKMEIEQASEYNHLVGANNRPDRRQINYDHVK
ncbi:hypothetical protein ACOMHN_008429 [Nucella lapillus]